MNTRCCGHADWKCIYICVKQLITINTSYPEEVLNSLYYMLNHKTTAALKPLQYIMFDVLPLKHVTNSQAPISPSAAVCHLPQQINNSNRQPAWNRHRVM